MSEKKVLKKCLKNLWTKCDNYISIEGAGIAAKNYVPINIVSHMRFLRISDPFPLLKTHKTHAF